MDELPDGFLDALARWRKAPHEFLEDGFGVTLWSKQKEILTSVMENRYTAVKACYSSGKSYVAAAAMFCFLCLHEKTIVLTTAPSYQQLKNLWQPAHEIYENYDAASLGVDLGLEMLTHEIRIGPNWYARGFSTDDPINIHGVHTSGHFLIIVDESAGVDERIHERLGALMTSERCHRLDIGNPLKPSGTFYECFQSEKYEKLTISAFDTPNVREEEDVVPGLVSKIWVDEKRADYGMDSPAWKAEVLGEFPDASEDQLIPHDWIKRAQQLWREGQPEGVEVYGFDPSGGGMAEAVLCTRAGGYVYPLKGWQGLTGPDMIRKMHQHTLIEREIFVDSIGVGFSLVGQAKEENLNVKAVNVQTAAEDNDRFLNLRAELYWRVRDALNPDYGEYDLMLPPDDKLAGQLSGLQYEVNATGKIKIESKRDMVRRGMPSPDRADSLTLTFCAEVGSFGMSPASMRILADSMKGLARESIASMGPRF